MATPEPARPIILPSRGSARVKSVLSGDTVILLGKASGPNEKAPEVVFTLENISAPRYVQLLESFVLFSVLSMNFNRSFIDDQNECMATLFPKKKFIAQLMTLFHCLKTKF